MAKTSWRERALLLALGAMFGWTGSFISHTDNPSSQEPPSPSSTIPTTTKVAEVGERSASPSASPPKTGSPADALSLEPVPAGLADVIRPGLRTADEARRTLKFFRLIENMTAADAPAVAKVFEDLRNEGLEFYPEGDFLAQRWGETDPQSALTYVETHGDIGRPGNSLEHVFTGWGMTSPSTALEWLLENPGSASRPAALKGLVRGWARSDPEAATAMVFGVLEGPDRERAAEMVTWQILYGAGMDAATNWFDRLPTDPGSSDARARAFGILKARQLTRGTDEAIDWVAVREAEDALQ